MENDIYAISGRIKNHIAIEDIALSPVGTILVNYFTLMLKDLHDFAQSLPDPARNDLIRLLIEKEVVPKHIIKVSTEKQNQDQLENIKADFSSNEAALDFFLDKYEILGAKYGKSGDEFWAEAEGTSVLTDDHKEIMGLHRRIGMCLHLVRKNDRE